LSGLSGSANQRLAIINDKTFCAGEAKELKVAGHAVQLTCLQIGQQSVRVQIQDAAGPFELTMSGEVISLAPPLPAASPQQVAPVESARAPAPLKPPVSNPTANIPQTVGSRSNFLFTPFLFVGGVVLAFLVGVALGGCARLLMVEHKNKNIGEALVAETISQQFKGRHLLLNNITLPAAGGTTQIDHVLIADTGIFVIETKHYSGWIFGHPQESQWTRQHYQSRIRFQNPLHQNHGHIKALHTLFALPDELFHSVVVFTGEAQFKTELGPEVLHLSGLVPFLSAARPVVFDERQMAYFVGLIEMQRERRARETDEYHINYVRRKIAAKIPKGSPILSPPAI
jgi:hypothetical protein